MKFLILMMFVLVGCSNGSANNVAKGEHDLDHVVKHWHCERAFPYVQQCESKYYVCFVYVYLDRGGISCLKK